MVAAVEHLPALLAAALIRVAGAAAESWQEMRKLAGSQFCASSFIVESDPKALAGACLANQANLKRWLDNLIAELGQWQGMLASGDEKELAAALEHAMLTAASWTRSQATNTWDDAQPLVEMPSAGGQFRRLFGFGGRLDAGKQTRKRDWAACRSCTSYAAPTAPTTLAGVPIWRAACPCITPAVAHVTRAPASQSSWSIRKKCQTGVQPCRGNSQSSV